MRIGSRISIAIKICRGMINKNPQVQCIITVVPALKGVREATVDSVYGSCRIERSISGSGSESM